MWSHGSFYWNELMTRDVEAAKKFYGLDAGLALRINASTKWYLLDRQAG